MNNAQKAENIKNAYHAHDISKLQEKSNIAVADYIEVSEKKKEKEIIAKYDLFGEMDEF